MNATFYISLLLAAATSGGVDVSVTLDPADVPFHRTAAYTVTVEAPSDVEVTLPDMLGKFAGLEASDVQRNTEPVSETRRRITETYILDPILINDYRIEPVTVTWGDGESVTVPSPALRVRDLTEEEKQAAMQFETAAGPLAPNNPLLRDKRVWIGLAAFALLAIAAAAYTVLKRRRPAHVAPPAPPWEVAYQRLRALDERHLPEAGKYDPFYVDLSSILRYYIEDRFRVRAPEQTTQEFLSATSAGGSLTPPHQQILGGFLRHCDRVKFAQYVPTVEEMEQSFTTVLQFVDETVPQPETDTAGQPAGSEAAA